MPGPLVDIVSGEQLHPEACSVGDDLDFAGTQPETISDRFRNHDTTLGLCTEEVSFTRRARVTDRCAPGRPLELSRADGPRR